MHFAGRMKVLTLLWVLCSSAAADTLKDPLEARMLTDRVMARVSAGDMAGGIASMRPFMIVPPAEVDVMLDQVKMQQPMLSQRFGKSVGHEFIREQKVGENVLRIVQLHRFEKHAMRWSFYFYRGSAGWVLNTFRTDDDIVQLFSM